MRKNTIIISVVLIIALFTTNISSFFLNQNLKKQINSLNDKISGLENANQELEKQNQEINKLVSEGWKEYINKDYNFKIWYPETFNDEVFGKSYITMDLFNYGIVSFDITDTNGKPQDMPPIPTIMIISSEKNNLDIIEYIRNDNQYLKNNIESKTFDQYITKEKSQNVDLYKIDIPNKILKYYVKKNDLVFTFIVDYTSHYPEKDHKAVFDQMVQSFRFTE